MLESSATNEVPSARLAWWVPLLLITATLLVYSNSFAGEFIFDDTPHIQNNQSIRALTPPRQTWFNTRRPFVKLTLAVQYQLHGLNVTGYHIVNVLIHLAAGLVLMGLIRRTLMLPSLAGRYGRAGPWIAAAVALLWLVHPIQTQAVTYIVQRAESMMSLMMLLSLYSLLRASTAPRRRGLWYALSIACCFVAMGTKEVGVVTPIVALLYDRTFLSHSFPATVKRRWWYFLLMFLPLAGVAWLGLGDIMMAGSAAGFGMEHITWRNYLLTQPLVILKYLALILWPSGLSLDHLHPTFDMVRHTAWLGLYPWQWALALMALVLIGSVIALFRKPWLGFLGLAFFAILAPSSSVLPVADIMVEHRVYLVSCIVILLFVLAGDMLLRKLAAKRSWSPQRLAAMAAAFVIVPALLLGARTWVRNLDYASSLSIWRATATTSPLNPRAWNNLGRSIYDDNPENIADAIAAYQTALKLLPRDAEVRAALGTLLAETGNLEQAEHHLRLALTQRPKDNVIRQRLGVMYMKQNRLADALVQFQAAATNDPDDDRAQLSLGVLLTRLDRDQQAIAPLKAAVTSNPQLTEAWLQLAGAQVRLEKRETAETTLRQATQHNPNDGRLWLALGQLLEQTDQFDAASSAYRRAVEASPQSLAASMSLGRVLEAIGDDRAAMQVYRDAGDVMPQASEPALRAAWLLATSHDASLRDGTIALRFMRVLASGPGGLKQPEQLDVLAAAQARAGQYDQAVSTARRAVGAAEVLGKGELAAAIADRLVMYQQGKPFTQPAP